jgi:CUG-BP- and ETR3-like factor
MDQAYAMQAGGSGHLDGIAQQLVMSLALNQQQLALVNQHLFSIQAMSGAQLHVSPGAPGVFHLVGGEGR